MSDMNISVDAERTANIKICGTEYPLMLTTKATKAISKKYGGLSDLGDKLMKTENFELALSEIIWLIALLANQPILIHNIQHPNDKREPLTEEVLELLTTPLELSEYKDAIMAAMLKGAKRHIQSEDGEPKNMTGA
jgi:hypothetical protein